MGGVYRALSSRGYVCAGAFLRGAETKPRGRESVRARLCRVGFLPGRALPFYVAAVPSVVQRLRRVRLLCETDPALDRYCVMAFGDSVRIALPAGRPSVRAEAIVNRLKLAKTAASDSF